jgi:Ni/Fe-hydrogenase subunit HybB-like protein
MNVYIQFLFGVAIVSFGLLGYIFECATQGKRLKWKSLEWYPMFKIFTAISIGSVVVLNAIYKIFLKL